MTYDDIYRLTGESINSDEPQNSGSVSYVLDPVGNRKSMNSSLPGINTGSTPNFNADDQLTTAEGESYDLNGNTTQTANGNQYTYDSENHLIKMVNGTTIVTMQYDAFGNRVSKTVTTASGTVITQYLVDDLSPTGYSQVVEELVNGVVTRQYTYGLQRISENLSPAVTGNSTWTPSFYGYDSTAGNVRQLTNSAGQVTDTYEYDAFGNKVSSTGSTPNNYLYRGEQWDPDLSLYYLRARYYNPLTGRFLSVDPEAGEGQRRYEYAGADPVNGMDPSGNEDLVEYAMLVFYPGRLSFIHVAFPGWCGIAGGDFLGECGAPGPGQPGAPGTNPGGPPPPPPPPCPKCDAQLKYRPVHIGNATHAFWYILDVYGQTLVIDGGPSNGDTPPWGYLTDWVTLGNVSSRYPADNASLAPTWFDSGLSSSVCGQVTSLEVSAEDWSKPNGIKYYFWGPNSNSFARYIGEEGLFNPTAPPGSVGWSHTIP